MGFDTVTAPAIASSSAKICRPLTFFSQKRHRQQRYQEGREFIHHRHISLGSVGACVEQTHHSQIPGHGAQQQEFAIARFPEWTLFESAYLYKRHKRSQQIPEKQLLKQWDPVRTPGDDHLHRRKRGSRQQHQ